MIKIVFNDSTIINCKFKRISENVIYLIGDIPSNVSGFKAYSGDVPLGDYSGFTTIYRTLDDGKQFSNNGSIWVEPTKQYPIYVNWNLDEVEDRPNSIVAVYTVNGEQRTLTIGNNWKGLATLNESETFALVSGSNVNGYSMNVSGDTIFYTFENPKPTWQEKVDSQLTYTAMMTDTLIEE